LTATAIAITSVGMMSFGLVDVLAPVLAPLSPMRLLEPFGVHLSDEVLAAGVIAIPTNFGSSIASMAVQVFINRTIPVANQGSVFGLQDVLKNALNICAVVAVGLCARVVPIEYVFLVTPVAVVLLVLWLIVIVTRRESGKRLTTLQAWQALTGHRLAAAPLPQA
jgi:hypothetical protein